MKLATANEQSTNEFNLVKLVNTSLKKHMINHTKEHVKTHHHSRNNSVELSGFQNSILEFHIVVILALGLGVIKIIVSEIIIQENTLYNQFKFGILQIPYCLSYRNPKISHTILMLQNNYFYSLVSKTFESPRI